MQDIQQSIQIEEENDVYDFDDSEEIVFSELIKEEKEIKLSLSPASLCSTLDFIYSIQKNKNCSLMDAVIEFSEESNVEIEELADALKKDKNFVESLRIEAIKANNLRKSDGFIRKPNLERFM